MENHIRIPAAPANGPQRAESGAAVDPGRELFWKTDADLNPGYIIALVWAEDHPAACEAFEVERFSPRVHACTTPALLAHMRGVPASDVQCITVDRTPSAYDRFGLGSGCPMDVQAMQDAGFDWR